MNEMMKLWEYLTTHEYNVSWVRRSYPGEIIYRNQIIVYDEHINRLWDAICHPGSYGFEQGLLEIYGSYMCDDVIGNLRAEDVINILLKQEKQE